MPCLPHHQAFWLHTALKTLAPGNQTKAKGKLGPGSIQNSRLRHQMSPNVPGVCMHKPQIAEAVGKYLKAGGSSARVFSADHRLIQG